MIIKIFGDIKKLALLGAFIVLSAVIFTQEVRADKFQCDLKSNEDNKIYKQVVIVPEDTNGRFNVIHNGRRVLAERYSAGIRWGAGVELSHATREFFDGDGRALKEIKEGKEINRDGSVWDFELERLNLSELFNDTRDAWGDKILKHGKCDRVG